jgi:release factor glutamine methyltransferase
MPKQIKPWLEDASAQLRNTGIESAKLDARLILESVLQKPQEWLAAHDDTLISDQDIETLNTKVARRLERVPTAYILHTKEFYGRDFYVNQHVLIPRSESESMISLLLEVASPDTTILDVGTGSGALAITAQLEIPSSIVVASDVSTEALAVAHKNALTLKSPVQFLTIDLLDLPSELKPDVILANLPYVPSDLITSPEITKEPALALFSGQDGLDLYKRFWAQLSALQHKPRYVITESLADQHQHLTELAKPAGYSLAKTDTLAQLFELNLS